MPSSTSASFTYRAVDATGRRVRGHTDGANAEAVTRHLEQKGLVVLDVSNASPWTVGHSQRRGRTTRQDILEATRALSSLLGAGLPLSRSLSIASSIVPARVGSILNDVHAHVAHGRPLSEALAEHPREFSSNYRGVVRAGERSGDLANAFAALARQLDADMRIRARLLSAMLYPMLLGIAGVIVIAVLVLFVLPRFAELLESTGAPLPRSTRLLLEISSTLRQAWMPTLAIVVAAVGAAFALSRTRQGQLFVARLLIQLPIVGSLRRSALAARVARLVGVLVSGGAPLLLALDEVQESLGDPVARQEIARVRARVRAGSALRLALAEGTLFPLLLVRLVAVGEESGRLSEFFQRAAELCEERVERSMQRLATLVEPAMILAFGALIAFLALSLLQAIYGVDPGTYR